MKITWFGGHCLRFHIGGEIVVFDPMDGGPPDTDHSEVVSGADQVLEWAGPFGNADAKTWRPRRTRALEASNRGGVQVYFIGFDTRLVDAAGEPPLVLMGSIEEAGSWSREAVVVAFSLAGALGALNVLSPRLIALALPEADLDHAITKLSGRLDSTSLVSLEPGLALEV